MALSDLFTNLHIWVRWLHVLAGILWIGHLYFFDFVTVPLQRSLDDQERNSVHPTLMLRALWWLRWAAVMTLAFGLILLVMTYFYIPGQGFGPTGMFLDGPTISDRAIWIFFGMAVAVVMFFNVWFVVEPAQKRLLLPGKASPEEIPFIRRRAFRALRTATFLSGPMLFGMLAPSHYGAINPTTLMLAVGGGLLIIWCAIKCSSSVNTSR